MSQPPTAPQDPYQFDPYRPQGGDPARQEPAHDAWAPQVEAQTVPYAPGDPHGTPGYGATQPQGYGQQQGYDQPYGDPTQQQPYPQAYPDPAQPVPGGPYGEYGAYAAPRPTGTLAIVGFILAILGVLGSWIPVANILAALLGIAGVVLGFVGMAQAKQGRSGKGFSIAAIILGVLSVLVTILMWVLIIVAANETTPQGEPPRAEVQEDTDRAPADPAEDALGDPAEDAPGDLAEVPDGITVDVLEHDLDVEFGTFEGTVDEYGWVESSLPVTFTNTSDEPLMFDIDVDAVAADGTVIESDWAFSDTVEPGASATVEIFDYIDPENVEAMKTATFEVTQASAY